MKIGQAQRRFEDDRLIRGEGSYTADGQAFDELAMFVLRSPVAAGSLSLIDVTQAKTCPGVLGVFTGTDMLADGVGTILPRMKPPGPDGGEMPVPVFRPLATDFVRYVGDPVAIVIAQSQEQAEAAGEAIILDIEQIPPVVDALEAASDDAPQVWPDIANNLCYKFEKGDRDGVNKAIANASHVVRQRLKISRVTAAPIEPRGALASFDAKTGRYRLETGTQAPHRIQSDLAPVLGVPKTAIQIVGRDCGGSFGMKNAGYPEFAAALWAARRLGRAVRWQASRIESFLSDAHARDQWVDAALALDSDGIFLGLDVHVRANLGAYIGPSTTHPPVGNVGGLAGVYRTPAIHVSVDGFFTNTQHTAPYRGAGRPEATYVIERMIDIAAIELGLDRAELRRRNLIGADEMPFKTALVFTYDSGDFAAVLDKALDVADWAGFAARRAASLENGRLRGIGIANPIEIAGGPAAKPNPEFSQLELSPSGDVRLAIGSSDSGQGHGTSFRQILSDRLGLSPELVKIITSDTDLIEKGVGTFGSRTMTAAGTALWDSMDQLIDQLLAKAAEQLEVEAGDIVFKDARYWASGTNHSIAFTEVLATEAGNISAESFLAADGATFPNGCHICEVEIDPDTGFVELQSYVVVDDAGTVINPMIVDGQIIGGIAQGLGQALMEAIHYDPESGQLLSATFMDYAMPRASDMAKFEIVSLPVPTANNPLGAKGAGEAGTVGALAGVMSAVCNALSPLGIHHMDMPATPQRVWRAIQTAQKR